jgi:amino acid transporter
MMLMSRVVCIINTRVSLMLSNTIGIIKLIILTFVGITGLIVLSGRTHIADPTANFRNAFAGTTSNGNGLATALVKVNYAYYGYENAFAVVSEIRNPVKTLKKCTPIALGVVFVLYMLANVAYFAAVPKEEIRKSGEMTASLFFGAVFGHSPAIVSALSALVAISAFGNLLATVIGSSRVIRECARQGVIPFPKFWASTKPFGTPLGPYLIKYVLTAIVILAPPDGDAFNFVVDLQSYPGGVFSFLMTLGLFIVRPRVKPTQIRIWNVVLVFSLVVNAFVLIMPWVPPEGGIYGGDVSFFYATYCVVGLAIIAICGIWYWVWIKLLPSWGGYEVRQEVEVGERGERSATLVKVRQDEMQKWEMEHDEVGNRIVVGEGVEK